MRGTTLSAIVLGTGLLVCCAPRVQQPGVQLPPPSDSASAAAASEEIRIARGPCFGFCPVYTIALTPAGRVDFKGERHTAVLGPRSRTVGRAAYDEVKRAFARFRPDTGSEREIACPTAATDMAAITVEWIAADGGRTAVTYRMGCREGEAAALAQKVDEQLGRLDTEGWAAQKTWPGDSRG